MLRPIGPDDLMSLRAAATIGDAAFDLALLRVGILAPAELDEIRSLVLHPTACLEPTRNSDGHLIIDVVERLTETLQDVASFISEKLSTIKGVISTATRFRLKSYKENGVALMKDAKPDRLAVAP